MRMVTLKSNYSFKILQIIFGTKISYANCKSSSKKTILKKSIEKQLIFKMWRVCKFKKKFSAHREIWVVHPWVRVWNGDLIGKVKL